jgi:putative DNA methylase
MTYRKKLIEVALPLEEINAASAREKSIRHGHPSTLHLWWARRPLATCRAVLFASIIDDPGEEGVPRALLEGIDRLPLHHKYRHLADEEPLGPNGEALSSEEAAKEKLARQRRYRLFTFIERLVQWENSNDPDTLETARSLIHAATGGNPPPVLDPFCGGGSIPLEAQRLGLEAHASDLNPVAVLITKAMIEIPPKFADQPPINPGSRNQEIGDRGALSRADGLSESNAPGHRSVSNSSSFAAGGTLRHEVTADESGSLDPGEHRGRLDTGVAEGESPVSGDRSRVAGRGGDLSEPLRTDRLDSERGVHSSQGPHGRSRENAHHDAETTPRQKNLTPNRLFPISYNGAQGLAEDVRYYGQWMRDEAERRIGHLYPKVEITAEIARERPDLKPLVGQKLTVIAWLWARTVPSPDPAAQGAHVPLVRSFVLSNKKGKEAWVEPVVDAASMTYRFVVRTKETSPAGKIPEGTIGRQGGRCLLTGTPMTLNHVRGKGQAGAMSERLMAVVAEGSRGRVYLSPDQTQAHSALVPRPNDAPSAVLPTNPRDFNTPNYGIRNFADLFTDRQLVALTTFSDLVREAREKVLCDIAVRRQEIERRDDPGVELLNPNSYLLSPEPYADAIATYLAFAVDKGADYWSSICSWHSSRELIRNTFGRQAIPMVWDFAECNPMSDSTGNWMACVDWVWKALMHVPGRDNGSAAQADATKPTKQPYLFSTDPPYFDNIGYADLSDFFYVWLRRSLGDVYPELFSTVVTPKTDELIATPYRHEGSKEKATRFFESGLRKVFARMREQGLPDYPTTIYYAFKQSETEASDDEDEASETASTGWETMLQGLVDSGFTVNGTWPTRTELGNRMIASGTNALASCIVLVCRPRGEGAETIHRRQFLSRLRQELKPALVKLTQGNVAPVDLAQAAIGPGMAVFSRYRAVLEADGSPMRVRTALALINQALDEALEEQEGWYDPQTRWAVTWFKQRGFQEGPYGEAETLATAKDAPVNTMVQAGIVKAGQGRVKLLSREELPPDYDPLNDSRTTVWEATQYLVRELDQNGELGAARMMRRFRESRPGLDVDRARELAYRLYAICDQKRWTNEARAYNALVISWSDIEAVSQTEAAMWQAPEERNLFSEA